MFAGIGGFRAGLTRTGGFQCVGHCEIDKYAAASYRAIHDIAKEERYYQDARKIDPSDLPDFNLLCGGFPCQAQNSPEGDGKSQAIPIRRSWLFFTFRSDPLRWAPNGKGRGHQAEAQRSGFGLERRSKGACAVFAARRKRN